MKEWKKTDYYNFAENFNRLVSNLKYADTWAKYFEIYTTSLNVNTLAEWVESGVVDLTEYNYVKYDTNKFLKAFGANYELNVSNDVNQAWTAEKANELERAHDYILSFLGYKQFTTRVCGQAICGSDSRIMGVN